MAPTEDETLLSSPAQAVAINAAAAQTIRYALIDAGVDLERVRAGSSVYYPDLLPQVTSVARRPEVIDAARSIRSELLNAGSDADDGGEIDACDVFGIILSITLAAPCTARIL
jgi:hypothetical protein